MNGRMKYVVGALLFLGLTIGGYVLWPQGGSSTSGPTACTEEAKICLDGSTVGRTGPDCEFAACPTVSGSATTTLPSSIPSTASTTDLVLSVGQTGKVDRFFITLNRFLEDNRCPIMVECVRAGSVAVAVTFARGPHTETDNIRSEDAPRMFENYRISIMNVSPTRRGAERISVEDYRVTFRVEETTFQ